jgi:hypothetical protein
VWFAVALVEYAGNGVYLRYKQVVIAVIPIRTCMTVRVCTMTGTATATLRASVDGLSYIVGPS